VFRHIDDDAIVARARQEENDEVGT
jgi:hypothetical protein